MDTKKRFGRLLALILLIAGCAGTDGTVASTEASAGTTADSSPAITNPSPPTTSGSPEPTTASPATPIDTTTWRPFISDRYGFSMRIPSDWTVEPADHDWTLAEDAGDWLSAGQEVFYPASRDVRVSAWGVTADDTVEETWADVEDWVVEQYCSHTDDPFCSEVHDRAVQLCIEVRDCHPGLLVPFASDVQAFLRGGVVSEGSPIVVVAVWRPEAHPSVAQYGGSRRLLETFLSTMEVCVKPMNGALASPFACTINTP